MLCVILASEYLRLRQGIGPEKPLVFAFGGGGGIVRKESPSLLGPLGPPVGAAFLFLSPLAGGGESSSSFSSFSWEECVSELLDDESDTTWRRELFRVPLAFFLVLSGTS